MELLSVLPNDQPSALTVSVLRTVLELGAHQNLAVSIWTPRAHPTTRFSARLRFYNKAFLALCDTHSFGGGNFGEVYPTAVLCYSPATARARSFPASVAKDKVAAACPARVSAQ